MKRENIDSLYSILRSYTMPFRNLYADEKTQKK